jgi:LysR family glycine cleavage system transcriptional activator
MPVRPPSLNSLRAFEAAGRLGSFTAAAEELHVTPAAVGHQVKALESHLGAALFVRLNRRLELTEAGQVLLPALSAAFQRLFQGVEAFQRRNAARPLTVSVEPSLGAKWLLRRLDHFRERHPGIEIRIDATSRVVDFSREQVDMAIRYGSGNYPGLSVDCLFEEQVFPVCSPALLQGERPLRAPSDLRFHTLLRTDWNPNFPTWPDWEMWLKAAGLEDIDASKGPQFSGDSETLSLQAAIEGHGVALASSVLAADDLASGKLVKPFRVRFPVEFCYFLVCPQLTADVPMVSAFREWLLEEAAATDTGA